MQHEVLVIRREDLRPGLRKAVEAAIVSEADLDRLNGHFPRIFGRLTPAERKEKRLVFRQLVETTRDAHALDLARRIPYGLNARTVGRRKFPPFRQLRRGYSHFALTCNWDLHLIPEERLEETLKALGKDVCFHSRLTGLRD